MYVFTLTVLPLETTILKRRSQPCCLIFVYFYYIYYIYIYVPETEFEHIYFGEMVHATNLYTLSFYTFDPLHSINSVKNYIQSYN